MGDVEVDLVEELVCRLYEMRVSCLSYVWALFPPWPFRTFGVAC
jgi:hypothetical protein